MPAVRMAEDMWLPQWAIAVIVIGLASLLFVLIFGITVVRIFFFFFLRIVVLLRKKFV